MSEAIPDAVASVEVPFPVDRVWKALTDPAEINKYFFGTNVVTEWRVGGPIVWRGEWRGKRYEDHGRVVEFDPPRRLRVTHFSPLTGLPDLPENYHTVTYELAEAGNGTQVTITQGSNRSRDEIAEAEKTWQMVLGNLRDYLSHQD
ncbi:MAG: SRPBCC domain-containing protein [Catenulispora sp.]|nr:SRPBCC domain-containing protein [Catenulispora sp.]